MSTVIPDKDENTNTTRGVHQDGEWSSVQSNVSGTRSAYIESVTSTPGGKSSRSNQSNHTLSKGGQVPGKGYTTPNQGRNGKNTPTRTSKGAGVPGEVRPPSGAKSNGNNVHTPVNHQQHQGNNHANYNEGGWSDHSYSGNSNSSRNSFRSNHGGNRSGGSRRNYRNQNHGSSADGNWRGSNNTWETGNSWTENAGTAHPTEGFFGGNGRQPTGTAGVPPNNNSNPLGRPPTPGGVNQRTPTPTNGTRVGGTSTTGGATSSGGVPTNVFYPTAEETFAQELARAVPVPKKESKRKVKAIVPYGRKTFMTIFCTIGHVKSAIRAMGRAGDLLSSVDDALQSYSVPNKPEWLRYIIKMADKETEFNLVYSNKKQHVLVHIKPKNKYEIKMKQLLQSMGLPYVIVGVKPGEKRARFDETHYFEGGHMAEDPDPQGYLFDEVEYDPEIYTIYTPDVDDDISSMNDSNTVHDEEEWNARGGTSNDGTGNDNSRGNEDNSGYEPPGSNCGVNEEEARGNSIRQGTPRTTYVSGMADAETDATPTIQQNLDPQFRMVDQLFESNTVKETADEVDQVLVGGVKGRGKKGSRGKGVQFADRGSGPSDILYPPEGNSVAESASGVFTGLGVKAPPKRGKDVIYADGKEVEMNRKRVDINAPPVTRFEKLLTNIQQGRKGSIRNDISPRQLDDLLLEIAKENQWESFINVVSIIPGLDSIRVNEFVKVNSVSTALPTDTNYYKDRIPELGGTVLGFVKFLNTLLGEVHSLSKKFFTTRKQLEGNVFDGLVARFLVSDPKTGKMGVIKKYRENVYVTNLLDIYTDFYTVWAARDGSRSLRRWLALCQTEIKQESDELVYRLKQDTLNEYYQKFNDSIPESNIISFIVRKFRKILTTRCGISSEGLDFQQVRDEPCLVENNLDQTPAVKEVYNRAMKFYKKLFVDKGKYGNYLGVALAYQSYAMSVSEVSLERIQVSVDPKHKPLLDSKQFTEPGVSLNQRYYGMSTTFEVNGGQGDSQATGGKGESEDGKSGDETQETSGGEANPVQGGSASANTNPGPINAIPGGSPQPTQGNGHYVDSECQECGVKTISGYELPTIGGITEEERSMLCNMRLDQVFNPKFVTEHLKNFKIKAFKDIWGRSRRELVYLKGETGDIRVFGPNRMFDKICTPNIFNACLNPGGCGYSHVTFSKDQVVMIIDQLIACGVTREMVEEQARVLLESKQGKVGPFNEKYQGKTLEQWQRESRAYPEIPKGPLQEMGVPLFHLPGTGTIPNVQLPDNFF